MELGTDLVDSFSAKHPLSLGVLGTRPIATFNTGIVHTSHAPGPYEGLGTCCGTMWTGIPVLMELLVGSDEQANV